MDEIEKKNLLKQINFSLVLLLFLLVLVAFQLPKKRLELSFCDVGQGDATLVSWGSYQMLVDGGPDSSVLSCLGKSMPFWDRKIELVVVTHPQADHMTGMIEVLKRYEVENFYMSGVENDIAEVRELKRVMEKFEVTNLEFKAGDGVRLGEVSLEVLYPIEITSEVCEIKDINEVSTVLRGSYGKFEFLLTGDIDTKIEDELRLTDKLTDVEVLKVAHHGSKTSTSGEFLLAVKPELAVISVGKNRFGHPTREVLERLRELGAMIKRTDEDGLVRLVSTGEKWWIK
jgi:competence protein ComEC